MQFRSLSFWFLPAVLALWLFSGCDEDIEPFSGVGKRPVYIPLSQLSDIKSLPPRPIVLSGSIFLRDSFFFMLEQRQGIHVFNVADPGNPVAVAFWQIPAIGDFSMSGNRLFVDSWRDLVTIDISDIHNIRSIDRQTGLFDPLLYPPLFNGIFECVDESKGAVAGWEDAFLTEARCRTFN
ncbi:MAG: hypothetical protein IAE84_07500 [Saprospiraceae bacterium]|jgi:hypothetical protein|nr:hypothetical protein [Saprospiraceae bacterium]